MAVVTQGQSLWDRWKHNVTHGWGHAPGAIIGGVTGKGIPAPTKKNDVIQPGSVADSAGNVVSDVGKGLSALADPQIWVRAGEIIAGVILLSVGIDHMFNMNLTAKGVGKLAPILM